MIKQIRAAKKAGCTREETWKMIEKGRRNAAKEQGWRPSELAATLADDQRQLDAVYGKKKGE